MKDKEGCEICKCAEDKCMENKECGSCDFDSGCAWDKKNKKCASAKGRLMVGTTQFASSADDCNDCVCATIWDPVCGVDGETYNSSCQADCAGVKYKDGECEKPECSKVMCRMYCEHGFMKDKNGCEICKCAEKPEEPECPEVMCKMFCEHGWQKGEDGCDMCKCAEDPCMGNKECASCDFDSGCAWDKKNKKCAKGRMMVGTSQFASSADDCKDDCVCPMIYVPVCGEDGVEYSSSCRADCA